MFQDDIFKLLLLVLLLENEKDGCGYYSSINEVLLIALLFDTSAHPHDRLDHRRHDHHRHGRHDHDRDDCCNRRQERRNYSF